MFEDILECVQLNFGTDKEIDAGSRALGVYIHKHTYIHLHLYRHVRT